MDPRSSAHVTCDRTSEVVRDRSVRRGAYKVLSFKSLDGALKGWTREDRETIPAKRKYTVYHDLVSGTRRESRAQAERYAAFGDAAPKSIEAPSKRRARLERMGHRSSSGKSSVPPRLRLPGKYVAIDEEGDEVEQAPRNSYKGPPILSFGRQPAGPDLPGWTISKEQFFVCRDGQLVKDSAAIQVYCSPQGFKMNRQSALIMTGQLEPPKSCIDRVNVLMCQKREHSMLLAQKLVVASDSLRESLSNPPVSLWKLGEYEEWIYRTFGSPMRKSWDGKEAPDWDAHDENDDEVDGGRMSWGGPNGATEKSVDTEAAVTEDEEEHEEQEEQEESGERGSSSADEPSHNSANGHEVNSVNTEDASGSEHASGDVLQPPVPEHNDDAVDCDKVGPDEQWLKNNEFWDRVTRLPVIDLFCGIGGFSLGLRSAGFSNILGVDIEARCVSAYRANACGTRSVRLGIYEKDMPQWASALRQAGLAGEGRRSDFVLVAGPPCQPYSIIGNQGGGADPRCGLKALAEFVKQTRPLVVLIENVTGMMHSKFSTHVQSQLAKIKQAGYTVHAASHSCSLFGVPQTRTRLLITCLRKNEWEWHREHLALEPTTRDRPPTAMDAISEAAVWKGTRTAEMRVSLNALRARERVASTDTSGLISPYRQAPSVITSCLKDASIHRCIAIPSDVDPSALTHNDLRALSLRHILTLQSFPSDFELFGGTFYHGYVLGNAVPPMFARSVGLALRNHIAICAQISANAYNTADGRIRIPKNNDEARDIIASLKKLLVQKIPIH